MSDTTRRGGRAVWPPMTPHSRSHPALRRGRWVGCLLSSSWRGTEGKLKWARNGRKGLKKAETPLSPRHHKPLSADIRRHLRLLAAPPRSHAVPTMVCGLGNTLRSIAFRIFTLVVRSGLVQQQFSIADVEAASEVLEKGDGIAGDMRTQSLDAGKNTATQKALTNVSDAIGSSADAAECSGDVVNEGTSKESTSICSAWTSYVCTCLKKQTNACQLSVWQRAGAAGAAVLLQPRQCRQERCCQRHCEAFHPEQRDNAVEERRNSLLRRQRHTRRNFYAWYLACSRRQVQRRRKSRVNSSRTTRMRRCQWRKAFLGL